MPIIPGAIVVPANIDDLSVTLEGARTLSQLYLYDGTNWDRALKTAAGLLVDTELPSAATLTDAFATPTAPAVGSFNMIYNGATWDMLREGNIAGSIFTDVTDRAARDLGKVDIALFDTQITAADATATPTTSPPVASINMVYNGATWDMVRSSGVTGALMVGGTSATGGPPTGNPVLVSLGVDISNDVRTARYFSDGDATNNGQKSPLFHANNYGYNGSTWDRLRTAAAAGAGLGVLKVHKQNEHDTEIRAASGPLSAGETTTPVTGLGAYRTAVIRLDVTTITTPDGDDEVDFYIQTSYNGGTDWADLENIHFDNADNGTTAIRLAVIGFPQTNAVARTETDGTLADDTKNDLPLGDRLRIKVVVAGATAPTYAYNAEASFKS